MTDAFPTHTESDRVNAAKPIPTASLSAEIIVPVHNGLEVVRACLGSLVGDLGQNRTLVIVDDGSQAPTRDYCAEFAATHPDTRLIRRPNGSGFTRAANAGLKASDADYQILLNSDTIVPPGWIEKIIRCGQSAVDIGLIGPLSNAASWQSIPELHAPEGGLAINELPDGIDVAEMDRRCADWARDLPYPRISLLNGFCMAIKRQVKETIGILDETHFPAGYGEENDYCLRAGNAGFGLLVAIDTYVYHAKSKSYSGERRKLLAKQGSKTLRHLHGRTRVDRSVQSARQHPVLVQMRGRARTLYEAARP